MKNSLCLLLICFIYDPYLLLAVNKTNTEHNAILSKNHPSFFDKNINLSLSISELYNYYDNDNTAKAFSLAKRLIIKYPLNADAYFVFGDINLKQKNYSTALDYLLIALKNKINFFYKIQELELYLSLGTLYYFKNEILLQKKYFNQIIETVNKNITTLSPEENDHYLAHANFFLGLQSLKEEKLFEGLSYLEKTIELNWNKKLCYFLLAHYLAVKDVYTINLNVERNQKGFFLEEKDKDKYFLEYYNHYLHLREEAKNYNYLITGEMEELVHDYYKNILLKSNK